MILPAGFHKSGMESKYMGIEPTYPETAWLDDLVQNAASLPSGGVGESEGIRPDVWSSGLANAVDPFVLPAYL
jgi:hypothetical protein